ncbi:MAG: hypothetical protein EPO40_34980 [Myxococcaceae bacterium]|nr:MAG: hypothetical protein EPO40_34980 [Myxococcaceae bacterium]
MIDPSSLRARLAVVAMLALSCRRDPPRPVATVDAPARLDAGARTDAAVSADAPAPSDAPADGATGTSIYLMAGGVEMMRPGQSVRLRVYRRGGPDVDVTAQAQLRVEPPTGGEISPDHVFHAGALGRHTIVATVGAEQTRQILEVSPEVPAGLLVVPSVSLGPGLPPLASLRLRAEPRGVVALDMAFVGATLSVSGRRRSRSFPMVVPIVRGTPGALFDGHRGPDGVLPVEGELLLDRHVGARLDGRAVLRTRTGPLRFSFSLFYTDVSALTEPLP